jgi:hypothetical protein
MRLRRSLAHRVEVRAPRDQIVPGPEALATSGAIELEDDPTAGPADATTELRRTLGRMRRLAQRFQAGFPTDERPPLRSMETPADAARGV